MLKRRGSMKTKGLQTKKEYLKGRRKYEKERDIANKERMLKRLKECCKGIRNDKEEERRNKVLTGEGGINLRASGGRTDRKIEGEKATCVLCKQCIVHCTQQPLLLQRNNNTGIYRAHQPLN